MGAAWLSGGSIVAAIMAGLAIFVFVGSLIEVAMRAWRPGLAPGLALRRAIGLPLSFWGAALAHMGVGMTLLGLAGVGFGAEAITTLHKGAPVEVGPYSITLDSVGDRVGPNYKETVAAMTVRSGATVVATIEPARRQFAARQMATTEAGLATIHFGQIYVSIADPDARWRRACATVLEAAGDADLARRRRDGAGRRAVARRSPAALRRRRPRESRRSRRGGGIAMRWLRLVLLVVFAALAAPSFAVQPDELMKDPALEARARALSAELRCMVCQNQSIDDSDAPLARDIRILIRQRIAKGESNDAVRSYLVSRYGDFILLKPPLKLETLLLWLSAPLTLCAGLAAVLLARRRTPAATQGLSAEEEAQLAALTGDERR